MTYIELINSFWQEFGNKGMQPNDVLLYFYLLDHCNRISWQNPFSLTNKNLMMMLDLSEKSVIGARNRLKERGLICIEKGDRNCKAPVYFIVGLEYTNFNCKISSRTADEWQMNGRRKAAYNKDYKTKDLKKETSKDVSKESDREGCLFGDEAVLAIPKKKRTVAPEPPTLEEVRTFFSECELSIALANPLIEAEKFFYYFESLKWRTSGHVIRKWQSRARVWILDNASKNEQPGTNRAGIRESEKQRRDDDFARHINAQLSGQIADESETADI